MTCKLMMQILPSHATILFKTNSTMPITVPVGECKASAIWQCVKIQLCAAENQMPLDVVFTRITTAVFLRQNISYTTILNYWLQITYRVLAANYIWRQFCISIARVAALLKPVTATSYCSLLWNSLSLCLPFWPTIAQRLCLSTASRFHSLILQSKPLIAFWNSLG